MEIEMDSFEILLVVAFIVLVGWGVTHLMSVKEIVMREPEQPKEPEVEAALEPVKPKRGRKKAVPALDAPVKPKRVAKNKVTK
jgi:hypothetical protein